MTQPTVTTRNGDVVGEARADGILVFRGIPYAEPPTGSNRFKPPQRRAPWVEPRDATRFGATAPQRDLTGPLAGLIPNVVIEGDDYLNLNVWTAGLSGSRPVMVFIHGGSWTMGSGAIPGYDGGRFARDGVVFVSINYRLASDGFLWFGEGQANLGILDQIAALEWVRDNIAQFGGDPKNVTVFGESAGGMSIGALLAMPGAKGLFRRAIMQSGAAHHTMSKASALLVANRLADLLGVERSREAVAAVPRDRLREAEAAIAAEVTKQPSKKRWGDVATNRLPFEPVVDGITLPERPIDAVTRGAAEGIDVMVGNNAEEALFLLVPSGRLTRIRQWLLYPALLQIGLPPLATTRTYRAAYPSASAGELFGHILTDWFYRIPAIRVAEAHPGTHVYEFAWRSPAFENTLGACHGVELPFVFDNLDSADWGLLVGAAAPQSVADDIHGAWVRFAATGDPGWPAYDAASRTVRRFGTTGGVLRDPQRATRILWDGRR